MRWLTEAMAGLRMVTVAVCCSLQLAIAAAAALHCQVTPDRSTVLLDPADALAHVAIEVDVATGARLAPFAAQTSDGLEAMTLRAMAYCAELPHSAAASRADRCGAELGKQMWACLSGTQESFRRDVDDDQVTKRWLVNEHVASGFRELCGLAAHNDAVFAGFRSHPAMMQIIEHVNPEQGEQYLSLLREHAPDLLTTKVIKRLRRADQLGGGQPISFGGGVDLSPNTLRYAWVHARLRHHFGGGTDRGWAAGWKVCEIGGGYGGQAALTLILEPHIREYVLYDQPEPAALAERFLKAARQSAKGGRTKPSVRVVGALEGEMNSVLPAAEDGGPCDLVISNYAVSELSVSLQWDYAQRLILDSKLGYFTVNFHHKHDSGNFDRIIASMREKGYAVDQYNEVPQTDDKGLNTVVIARLPPPDPDAAEVSQDETAPAGRKNTTTRGEQLATGRASADVRDSVGEVDSTVSLSVAELRGIVNLRRAKSAAGGEQAWADLSEAQRHAALEAARTPAREGVSATEKQELVRLAESARTILHARGGTAREALWAALAS